MKPMKFLAPIYDLGDVLNFYISYSTSKEIACICTPTLSFLKVGLVKTHGMSGVGRIASYRKVLGSNICPETGRAV
jgi:hypothetical protein